jgi:hypothetical protein
MTTNENGLTLEQGQPVKTLSKHTTDFTAAAARYASVNNGYNVLFLVLALQFVLIVWGVTV